MRTGQVKIHSRYWGDGASAAVFEAVAFCGGGSAYLHRQLLQKVHPSFQSLSYLV